MTNITTPTIPSTFVQKLQKIIQSKCPSMAPIPWKFERSISAAMNNYELINKFNGNLEQLFSTLPHSVTHYGSEFRPSLILEDLLLGHPKWEKFKNVISHGVIYPSDPINEKQRLSYIKYMSQGGNHPSALSPDGLIAVQKAYDKEVSKGWKLPILPSIIYNIDHACVTPLGAAQQWTIDSDRT